MYFYRSLKSAVILSCLCFGGCATQNVAEPGNITLKQALVDTADALSAAHARGTNFGFYGCTVTAVFNVSATAGQENKLSLTASPAPPVIPVSAGATAVFDSTASGTRANTVTVVLATKPCMKAAGGSDSDSASGSKGKGDKKKSSSNAGPELKNPPPVLAPR